MRRKKSNKSEESTHGPQYFEFDDKKALDKILLKLLDKYGKKELVNALGGHEKEKQKHKKKDKKSKKSKEKIRTKNIDLIQVRVIRVNQVKMKNQVKKENKTQAINQ